MSSTNRGAKRERDDFYETPAWATRALLEQVLPVVWEEPRAVLDPFAGRGAILDVCATKPAPRGSRRTIGIEVDATRAVQCSARGHRCTHADAFSYDDDRMALVGAFDVIITNPPFSVAHRAAEWCLARAQGRPVAMLLRLAFLESMERVAFHRCYPASIYVLPRRPSFLSKEGRERVHAEAIARWEASGRRGHRPSPPSTDSCAYAWFVWWPYMERSGRWQVLDVERDA